MEARLGSEQSLLFKRPQFPFLAKTSTTPELMLQFYDIQILLNSPPVET